jgi:hypothetical protein
MRKKLMHGATIQRSQHAQKEEASHEEAKFGLNDVGDGAPPLSMIVVLYATLLVAAVQERFWRTL